jgi:putative membrane protein insertion efficiency factor
LTDRMGSDVEAVPGAAANDPGPGGYLLRWPVWGALGVIRAYQLLLSPLFPACCRFTPSCSHYAAEALGRYGFFKGLHLGLRRLLRCHPFHPGGWDPVP